MSVPPSQAQELWTREEFERIARHEGMEVGPRPRPLALYLMVAGVLTGLGAIIAGVALIYWPAALIVGGIVLVTACALFVDIPARAPKAEP
jgi:hypothetical protein